MNKKIAKWQISKENKEFIDSLIDYYINESGSYKQIAENFAPEIESVPDTSFGIIVGCVYSGFMQACQNQQHTPDLDEMKEFNEIIKEKAAIIKKSILEPPTQEIDEKDTEQKDHSLKM